MKSSSENPKNCVIMKPQSELQLPNSKRLPTTPNSIPPQPQRRANPFAAEHFKKGGTFFWYFSLS